MYFDYNGIQYEVRKVMNDKGNYDFMIICTDCGDFQILTEFEFVMFAENDNLQFYSLEEDEDLLECECGEPDEYSEKCYDGLGDSDEKEMGEIDEIDQELYEDVLDEIFEIKEELNYLRDSERYEEYAILVKAYADLIRLLQE